MEQQAAKRQGLSELRDLRKVVDVVKADMTLFRQAMEGAQERWDTVQAPDYSQEFGKLYKAMIALEERVSAVEQSWLIENPRALVREVNGVCTQKIADQAKAIEQVVEDAQAAVKGMSTLVASARKREKQSILVWMSFLAGVIASTVLIFGVYPNI